jgi:rare lipoprotein A
MVERQNSRMQVVERPRWFWVGAVVISLAAAATVFSYSTLTVHADTPLARPASTLPPTAPLSGFVGTAGKPKFQLSGLSGLATYYGEVLDGHRTASGERFDMFAMTAAHKTLPFGTVVRVVNTRTGRSVDVRVNDRGELPGNHVIDLSYEAAKELNILKTGVANVKLEVLSVGRQRHVSTN